ncbi:GNAT family N-acetyltransferase [Rossellomorea oryzaecorticis]|uniref:GNAT family N-acetyltransferase n=1 Tax=Rossellomorea oryzaecorticis TaxID=1396505 RepID=A0ABW8VQZ0_9BACI
MKNVKIIGSVRAREYNGTCHITKLMVHPDFQGIGFGKELMTAIEKVLRAPDSNYLQAVTVSKI